MCWGYNSGVRSWVCSLDAHTRQKDEKLEHLIYEWSLNIWVTQNYLLNQAYTFCFSSHFNQVQTSKAPPLQSNSFSDSTNYTGPSLSLPAENNFWTPWTEQWSGTERCFHLEWAVFEKRREGGVRSIIFWSVVNQLFCRWLCERVLQQKYSEWAHFNTEQKVYLAYYPSREI